jgi:hypothetical protein
MKKSQGKKISDRQRVANAFRDLRKKGWFARTKFWCCQGCGCSAVPDDAKNKFVFYHKQDAESFDKNGMLSDGMYLTHGQGGDGMEIVAALNSNGLKTSWNGDMGIRILVTHKD